MTVPPKNQDPAGGTETRNKEAAMRELIMSAVETAVKPVTSGLGNLQQRLDTLATVVQENAVDKHAKMLQSHTEPLHTRLGTLRSDILDGVDQRSMSLNSNLESLRNQTITVDQHLAELGQSVQAARDVVTETSGQVQDVANAQHVTNGHITDVLVSSRQIYNAERGLGLDHPFKIIPFVNKDGGVQWPTACGLPPLLDMRMINNLKDHELDQYLDGYRIQHVGLDREVKLSKLREYIGCMPVDNSSPHGMAFVFMLAMGCLLYLYFPHLFV